MKKYNKEYRHKHPPTTVQKRRKTMLQKKRRKVYMSSGHGNPAHLKWKYGLTVEQVLTKKQEQNTKCAICEKSFTSSFDCVIDHNHATSQFRGLLCRFCNQGLGFFKDSSDLLQKAARYLNSSEY